MKQIDIGHSTIQKECSARLLVDLSRGYFNTRGSGGGPQAAHMSAEMFQTLFRLFLIFQEFLELFRQKQALPWPLCLCVRSFVA